MIYGYMDMRINLSMRARSPQIDKWRALTIYREEREDCDQLVAESTTSWGCLAIYSRSEGGL
jgi:hypothetical protein